MFICKNHTITMPRYENNLLFHRFWSVDDEQVAFTITIMVLSIIIINRIVILIIIVIITQSILRITPRIMIITTSIVIIMIVNLI